MSRYLTQNTATTVLIGQLFDFADSKTLLSDALGGNTNFDPTDLVCTLTKGTVQSTLTLTKTGGTNDMNLVSGGMATIELTAADTDTEGDLILSFTNAVEGSEVIFPCEFEFVVTENADAPPTYINLSYSDVNAASRYYAELNGASQQATVTISDDNSIDAGIDDFSIGFWAKIPSACKLFSKQTESGSNVGYRMDVDNSGYLSFSYGPYNNGVGVAYDSFIFSSSWRHIGISVDRDSFNKLYIDGNLVATDTDYLYAGSIANAVSLIMGNSLNQNTICFDDVRFFNNVALTAAHWQAIYNGGIGTQAILTPTPSWRCGFDVSNGNTIQGIKSDGFELNGTKSAGVTLVAGGVPFIDDLALTANIEQAIYYLLSQDVELASVISTRVYPAIVPQGGVLPCVTFQQISGVRDQELEAASGFVTSRFQINCWAKTYGGARQLSNLVRTALAGTYGSTQGKYIYDIQLEDENDMPQVDAESDIISRYGKRLDFQVFFNE